jgi:hypothetical protein
VPDPRRDGYGTSRVSDDMTSVVSVAVPQEDSLVGPGSSGDQGRVSPVRLGPEAVEQQGRKPAGREAEILHHPEASRNRQAGICASPVEFGIAGS